MKITANILAIALTLGLATATLSPATSNTKGKYPKSPSCSPAKTSKAIQAAECSHNTRTSKTQTFAIFKVDHQYDANHGAPYGTCEAYTCTAPTASQLSSDSDYWTFFWNDNGESSGEGAGCIKDPQTGVCGCENSDGTFVSGSSSCK
ncbi:MAG: Carboxylic ester hydrolase [Aureobasidium pullulans]|nr:MAG: Carboxylic ester hydrolase [Aureobasidium pullulans]